MHGRIAGLIAAILLTAGLAPAGRLCAAGEAAPEAQPRLDVRQTMPEWVAPGEVVPVDVIIRNTGSAPAENVTVTSTLPASLDLTEANPPPGRVREALSWALGTLEPGGRQVLHLRLTPHAGASVAEVRSAVRVTYQTSVSSSCATPVRRPELALDVAGPDTALVGEPVTLQVTVRNHGAVPARGVSLQTLLPAGLSHPGGRDLENEIGTLAAGESRQASLTVTPTQPGDQRTRIRACVAGAEPVEREARLRVQEIKVALAANGPRLLYENWPGTFELALRNEGTEAVAQACLAVTLPDGLAFVRASDGGVYAAATHSLYWDLGTLRPGEQRTLVWNGVARQAGEQVCRVKLAAGLKATQQLTWQTTVARAGPESPAARAGTMPAAAPSAPAPAVPPLPPPVAPAPPPPGLLGAQAAGRGVAATPPAPGAPPADSFLWRPSSAAPQRPPVTGGMHIASP